MYSKDAPLPSEFPFPVLDFTKLQAQDPEECHQFYQSLYNHTIALVTMLPEHQPVLEQAYRASRQFFSLPEDQKLKYKMPDSADTGYILMPEIKEHLQMRASTVPEHPWPADPADFRQIAHRHYSMMMGIGSALLSALAIALRLPPERLAGLLDAEPLSLPFSATIFRYFRYFAPKEVSERDEGCAIHTDVGLLTMIPSTETAGLSILHPLRWERVAFEKLYARPNTMIVFPGESLEYITSYHIPACIHSVDVKETKERESLVFLMRGRLDAMLDPTKLGSPVIEPHPECMEPMTSGEFIRRKYAHKRSANLNPAEQKY